MDERTKEKEDEEQDEATETGRKKVILYFFI
jgi:hypothetical protein